MTEKNGISDCILNHIGQYLSCLEIVIMFMLNNFIKLIPNKLYCYLNGCCWMENKCGDVT